MGKARGFLEIRRGKAERRPVEERVRDWHEFEHEMAEPLLRDQAARCMDCGVPYCHDGCPLGNLIPEWNDLVYQGRFNEAVASLHATNNFPEITGRVCPAPCEASCVLNLEKEPVTIKQIERSVAERALAGPLPRRTSPPTGFRVAVVGSGPAGLAAAQELGRRGHAVVVYEKSDRVGGLLRYGIPDFKLEKHFIDRRMEQMAGEGVTFKAGVHVGVDLRGDELRSNHDAVVLAGGAQRPRDLTVPGRELAGVHFAMDFLSQQNRRVAGDVVAAEGEIVAARKRVIVLGGGDTGSDCIGTSHRQGAAHVLSLELLARPPDERRPENAWPTWPLIFRSSSSHDEGGARDFGVMTVRLHGEGGQVTALEAVRVDGKMQPIPGTTLMLPADLVLLAMGFLGPITDDVVAQLGCALDRRGNVSVTNAATSVPGVFAAGDMARGQSLVVWAIAEGRRAAAAVHRYLEAKSLPRSVAAGA